MFEFERRVMKKFKRAGQTKNKSDAKGTVRVTIVLQDINAVAGKQLKGNLSKSFSVDDTKVSEVYDALVKFLFE